jgi:hypothetical protein
MIKAVFYWSIFLMRCWKKSFVIFNNENTTDLSKIPKIIFCLGSGYISGYNVKFILRKLIIILDLLFFQITNAGEVAAFNWFNGIDKIYPSIIKGSRTILIVFLSFWLRLYGIYLKREKSALSRNGIDILILSLNMPRSVRKS